MNKECQERLLGTRQAPRKMEYALFKVSENLESMLKNDKTLSDKEKALVTSMQVLVGALDMVLTRHMILEIAFDPEEGSETESK